MLSKNKIKFINSLKQKKYRKLHNLFICEGIKICKALLNSDYQIQQLYITEKTVDKNPDCKIPNATIITDQQMQKISSLKTPQGILAIVEMKNNILNIKELEKGFTIVLDNIQDPGNLGTIIRTALWFDIKNIVCSPQSVDLYNPKVIQASMGAIFGVNIFYTDLIKLFSEVKNKIPIYGTFADGENIYYSKILPPALIVFGNEANGINNNLLPLLDKKIAIPSLNNSQLTDSLNVAVSTAIITAEIKRHNLQDK